MGYGGPGSRVSNGLVFQYPPLYSAPMKLVRVLAISLFFTASLAAEPLTLLDGGGLLLRFIDTLAPGNGRTL